VTNKPQNARIMKENHLEKKDKSLTPSQMEALTSPRSFLSLEHESSNSRRKTRVALLHSRNAQRLQHHSLRFRSFSFYPVLPGSSPLPSAGRVVRFALRFARNGATGCQERVLACCILQSEMVRSTGMNCGSATNTFRY